MSSPESKKDWQTSKRTIRDRCAFVFNDELLSDVKFVVRASNGNESKKVIPAHKFVLSIGSPVFLAMFHGKMAERSNLIHLPDCDYDSLLEFFRYLYSDDIKLSGTNVMEVLYLANKYMVPSLADKCTDYLNNNVDVSNVFCILPLAQQFEETGLVERCWELVDEKTEEILRSDDFVELDKCLLESVVKRESLCVKEIELFKAVDRWATRESEKQGLQPASANCKRKILGEEVVKGIRFPLMLQKEFMSVVPDSNVLTTDEIINLMKYFSGVPTTPLPFSQTPRQGTIKETQRNRRFGTYIPPAVNWFSPTRRTSPESTRC